jgi:hypothetical protein
MSKSKFKALYADFVIYKKAEDKEEVYFVLKGREVVCDDLDKAKRKIEEIMREKPQLPGQSKPTNKNLPSAITVKKKNNS